MSREDIAGYITGIDRERARLRAMLRSRDAKLLARRPANGDWSIVENVRHLLFAEQLHLGGFLPNGFDRSHLGLTGMTAKKFVGVASVRRKTSRRCLPCGTRSTGRSAKRSARQ